MSDEPLVLDADEIAVLRAMVRRERPQDPLRQWARRRLIAAGLYVDEPERPRGPVGRPMESGAAGDDTERT